MADLQQTIDMLINDPMIPRGVITVKNQSGSVKLVGGLRYAFLNCSQVTVDSGDDKVDVAFVSCQTVNVNSFKSGVIRFDQSSSTQVQNLTATSVKVNCDSAQIQQINLEDSEINLINAKIQQAAFKGCDVHSFNNTYSSGLSFEGGTVYMDNDTVSGSLQLTGGANINGTKLTISGAVDIQDSSLVMDHPTFSSSFTSESSHILISNGTFSSSIDATKDGTCVLTKATCSSSLNLEDGQFVLTDGTYSGSITINNATFTGNNLTCKGSLTANADDAGNMVLVKGTYQGLTATKMAIRISGSQFQGEVNISKGALDSDGAQYQTITMSEGTITSFGDKMMTGTFDQMAGPNILRSTDQAQTLDFTGDQTTSLLVDDLKQGQTVTINDLSTLRMVGSNPSQLNVASVTSVQLDKCQIDTATVNAASLFVMALGTTITQLKMTDCQAAVTTGVSDITGTTCTFLDTNSTFSKATDCIIIGTGSTITTSTGCVMTLKGGTATSTDPAVITSLGATVMNPMGLTVGIGFDVTQSGGVVCYGADLTLQANMGKVIIKSAVDNVDITGAIDIDITAEAGDVNVNAGGDINLTDGF